MTSVNFRIYVSMPITGYDLNERKQKAENVRRYLQEYHPAYDIVTPFDMTGFEEGHDWEWYMVRDLAMIDRCDALYMLKGWEASNGCKFERAYAEYHRILIFDEQ